jgi:hypothetical protein
MARIEVGEYVIPKAQTVTVTEIVEHSLDLAQSKGNRNVRRIGTSGRSNFARSGTLPGIGSAGWKAIAGI